VIGRPRQSSVFFPCIYDAKKVLIVYEGDASFLGMTGSARHAQQNRLGITGRAVKAQ